MTMIYIYERLNPGGKSITESTPDPSLLLDMFLACNRDHRLKLVEFLDNELEQNVVFGWPDGERVEITRQVVEEKKQCQE